MTRISACALVVLAVTAINISAQNIGERYDSLNQQATQLMFKDSKQALSLLLEAKRLIPGLPLAYVNSGAVLMIGKEDRTDNVQREFQHALAMCRTRSQLKSIMSLMEIPSQAFFDKKSPELYQQGKALIEEGKCREAIPVLREALEISPRISLTSYELGYAFVDVGEIDSALFYLERGRKLNPANPNILKELAFCYSHMADLDNLRQVVAEIEFLHGENPHFKRELALGYNRTGLHDIALAILAESLEKFPDYHICAYTMGSIYFETKNDPKNAKLYLMRFVKGVEGKSQEQLGLKFPGGTIEGMLEAAKKMLAEIESAGTAEP